jgi:hypothetical protein
MQEQMVSEQAITITVDSDKALTNHIHQTFAPEQVYGFRCDQCQALSSTECPEMRQCSLCPPNQYRRTCDKHVLAERLPPTWPAAGV